jgi:glycosyltransferase involved in cell wall biosynthesis
VLTYDYLQRHEPILTPQQNAVFLEAARGARRVWVTTKVSREDAIQFAGIPSERVVLMPMLAPRFPAPRPGAGKADRPYFVWPTNPSPHKNHDNAAKALRLYYEELDGQMDCRVVGNGSDRVADLLPDHFVRGRSSTTGREQISPVSILGELPDGRYQSLLAGAEFLWHPARRDNGTFCVVEAASLGVPGTVQRLSGHARTGEHVRARIGVDGSGASLRYGEAPQADGTGSPRPAQLAAGSRTSCQSLP